VEDGLVVCFRLDDNDGAIALDSSGNGRHGTLIGTGLTWVKGRNGGALRSRGLDRTARLEFSTAGMSAARGTASLWAHLANPQPSRTRYLFGHTSERQFANRIELYMDPGGTLLNVGFADAHATAINTVQLSLETWCHIALTWDDGVYVVYFNGVAVKIGGYMESPFAERRIVHEGERSMPFEYNNVGTPFYSEARREFRPARDWTVRGADTLALWVLGAAPAYTEEDGLITMTGGGHDIGDSFDDFRFACRILQSIEDTNAGAKAGVMIRESLAPESKFVSLVVSPDRSVSMGWRPWAAGIARSVAQASTGAPQWVKLTRAGSLFSAQHSADGITWMDLKTATGAAAAANVAITDPVYVGLCVTSRDPAAMATAVMSDVAVVGQVGGPWQVETIGDDVQPTNDPADLYVIVEDSSGRSAAAVHPTAVTLDEWTRWEIPFTSLTGVNVRSIKGLSLGVGGKGGLGPGGRGRIYLDDIAIGRPPAGR
jgi:hypothetical protein